MPGAKIVTRGRRRTRGKLKLNSYPAIPFCGIYPVELKARSKKR